MSHYATTKKNKGVYVQSTLKLAFRLLMVLLLFSISRWLLYLVNTEFFHHLTLGESLRLYLIGMRFDWVVIAYANIPVILYYCLPTKVIFNRVLHKIIDVWYVFANSVIILLNMVDVIYFRVIGKRITWEFFRFFSGTDDDITPVLSRFFADYWYMPVLTLLFILMLVAVAKRSRLEEKTAVDRNWYYSQWCTLLVYLVLTLVACRGGLQAKPINQATAMKYADSQNVPILLNTPFGIIKSGSGPHQEPLHYYEPEEMEFSPIHYNTLANRFVQDSLDYQPNIVYLVLEGIGQEMITYYHPQRRYPITPFLDKLLGQSLTFDGRANGRRPIESLPALFSGLPVLMEVDPASFRRSPAPLGDLGKVLREHGYQTVRFREWEACKQTLDTISQPFAAVLYPRTPHDSKSYPDGLVWPDESYLWSGFEKNIYTTDALLHDFFKDAASQPWYDSTLFVITSDRANNEHYHATYNNIWGMYAIPLAFYMPSRLHAARCEEIAQQADLNVSILSALGVNDTVFSFGRNLFDSLTEPAFIAYLNLTYQFSDGNFLLQSDGEQIIGIFNIKKDPALNDNLTDLIQCPDLMKQLRERIQEYNNRLIQNQLYINKEALHEQAEDTIHHQSDLWQEAPQGSAQPD